MVATDTGTGIAQAGKYLTFILGGREYGLGILKVQEIHGLVGLTRAPGTPGFVAGVVNLRGRTIPVVNLRERFGLPEVDPSEKTCIVVVQPGHGESQATVGLIVDEVVEVLPVTEDRIEGSDRAAGVEPVMGTGRFPDKNVLLLDVDALLSGGELTEAARMNGAA